MTTVSGAILAVQTFLADGGDSPSDVDPTTGKGPEWGEAAPIGLLVIVLLCVAVYFLVKSLNRNLKKVPESFDNEPALVGASSSKTATASTSATGTTASAAGADPQTAVAETEAGTAEGPAPKADPPPPSATP